MRVDVYGLYKGTHMLYGYWIMLTVLLSNLESIVHLLKSWKLQHRRKTIKELFVKSTFIRNLRKKSSSG
jgi:hypothetical protein